MFLKLSQACDLCFSRDSRVRCSSTSFPYSKSTFNGGPDRTTPASLNKAKSVNNLEVIPRNTCPGKNETRPGSSRVVGAPLLYTSSPHPA